MVPKLLNVGQKERRVQVCQDILEQLETEPNLLKRVVTGDESWIFRVRSTHQTAEPWMEERIVTKTQKGEGVQVQNQVMLIAFFDVHGIVHAEFLPLGQSINQHVYNNILQRLTRSVIEKKRERWETRSWLLHYDNAPAHNT